MEIVWCFYFRARARRMNAINYFAIVVLPKKSGPIIQMIRHSSMARKTEDQSGRQRLTNDLETNDTYGDVVTR